MLPQLILPCLTADPLAGRFRFSLMNSEKANAIESLWAGSVDLVSLWRMVRIRCRHPSHHHPDWTSVWFCCLEASIITERGFHTIWQRRSQFAGLAAQRAKRLSSSLGRRERNPSGFTADGLGMSVQAFLLF